MLSVIRRDSCVVTTASFGTISFEEAAMPAYELAYDGFAAYPVFVRHFERYEEKYRRWASSRSTTTPDIRARHRISTCDRHDGSVVLQRYDCQGSDT